MCAEDFCHGEALPSNGRTMWGGKKKKCFVFDSLIIFFISLSLSFLKDWVQRRRGGGIGDRFYLLRWHLLI